MAVRTHGSTWRMLTAGAPLLGAAFVVFAVLQGEPEMARSRTVMAILAGVAALGGAVATWTRHQLRAAPTMAVALAQAGPVSLAGRATALPDAPPLVSPDGTPCLWFKHSEQTVHQYSASDSVRPFLLVDETGQCLVLPTGADITGGGTNGTRERLLREGDEVHVTGWFTPVSAQAIALQDPATTPVALPVVGKPPGAAPFIISIGSREGQAGFYGMLAALDGLVLLAALGNLGWIGR